MPMFDSKAEAFLNEVHFARLATVKKNGAPHLTPIWYMYEDGKLLVNTTPSRVKYRNIEREPRVSLLVDDAYSYLIVEGRARVAKERDAKRDIETLAIRYHGEDKGRKSAREIYWKMPRVSLEIMPERIIAQL